MNNDNMEIERKYLVEACLSHCMTIHPMRLNRDI